jgi:hypothetical protein
MSDLLDKIEPVAAQMRKVLLGELRGRVPSTIDKPWPELSRAIRGLTRTLEKSNAWRVQDEQGAVHLKVACSLLAVYRTLAPLFENREALLDTLKEVIDHIAFRDGADAFLLERFGISSDAPEEAWGKLCTNLMRQGEKQYGRSWCYEQGIRDKKRYFVNITKCGFADFFLENGAREVLYLLCAVDYIWGDALEKYGIRFERPTTLSEGSDACRFQFFKIDE